MNAETVFQAALPCQLGHVLREVTQYRLDLRRNWVAMYLCQFVSRWSVFWKAEIEDLWIVGPEGLRVRTTDRRR